MSTAKNFLKYTHSFGNYDSLCAWSAVASSDIYNKVLLNTLDERI